MKLTAGFFAILGLAFHLRIYRIFADPVLAQYHESIQQNDPSILGLLIFFAIPWVPLFYYGVCLACCFVKFRNKWTTAIGLATFAISTPYFVKLNEIEPHIARNCLYAGGLAIYIHLSVPTGGNNQSDDGLLLVDDSRE